MSKKTKIIIIITAAVLVLALAVTGVLFLTKDKPAENLENAGNENAVSETGEASEKQTSGKEEVMSWEEQAAENDKKIAEEEAKVPALVALTFDDGPNDSVRKIVDVFNKNGGKATFFVIGNKITDGEQVDNLRYAYNNGFEIGSHTMNHLSLPDVADDEKVKKEFTDCEDRVYEVLGTRPKIARLPGLSGDSRIYGIASDLDIALIGSAANTNDWSGTDITAEYISNYFIKSVNKGYICCLHATDRTATALETILPALSAKGYKFVTVSELYKQFGYKKIPLGSQLSRAEVQ